MVTTSGATTRATRSAVEGASPLVTAATHTPRIAAAKAAQITPIHRSVMVKRILVEPACVGAARMTVERVALVQ
jgi:hypothetical protein